MRSWYVTDIFGALYMNTHHEWITSGIRQRRSIHVRSFLSSSFLSEEDLSSNYFYIYFRKVKDKRALLRAPSFLEEKRDWASSQSHSTPAVMKP